MSETKLQMLRVALPTEVPTPPALDQLPVGVLHTATTEMLIQQNEDLSARLKVNIRRNSLLEQKILELETQLQTSTRQKENLQAQNEVLKERETQWIDKKKQAEQRLGALESEIKLLELRYHELQASINARESESRERLQNTRVRMETAERRLLASKRIKERAKDRLRSFLWDAAKRQHEQSRYLEQLKAESKMVLKKCQDLEEQIGKRDKGFREQIEKIKSASLENIRLLQSEKTALHHQLESTLEKQKQHEAELFDLKEKLIAEQKLRLKVSQMNQDLAELRNERVQLRRSLHDKDLQFAEALEVEREAKKRAESQLEQRDLQLNELKVALETCEVRLIELSRDNKDLSLRLETTQKLWIQAQEKLEREEAKAKALEQINTELSRGQQEARVERARERAQSGRAPLSPGPQMDV